VSRSQLDGSLRPYSRFSRREPLLFLQSSSPIVLTRLSGPRFRPTTSLKNLVAPGIEPGPLDLWPETLTTGHHSRSTEIARVDIPVKLSL
jgi:hypothetical protein